MTRAVQAQPVTVKTTTTVTLPGGKKAASATSRGRPGIISTTLVNNDKRSSTRPPK